MGRKTKEDFLTSSAMQLGFDVSSVSLAQDGTKELTVEDLPGFSRNVPAHVQTAITQQAADCGVDVRLYLFAYHRYPTTFEAFLDAYKESGGSISQAVNIMSKDETSRA